MHRGEALQFSHRAAVLISFFTSMTMTMTSSLEMVVTGSKVVARPGESAELLCQADHPIQECSFYAPEDSQDNTREVTLVMIY